MHCPGLLIRRPWVLEPLPAAHSFPEYFHWVYWSEKEDKKGKKSTVIATTSFSRTILELIQ